MASSPSTLVRFPSSFTLPAAPFLCGDAAISAFPSQLRNTKRLCPSLTRRVGICNLRLKQKEQHLVKAFYEEQGTVVTAPVANKKSKVPVKPKPPRLVLRFLWLEKNIGIGLDQVVPGHGTVPLSPFYFWPRKDAWEELKAKLESKPWISQKRTIILLNQATDIINLWQQSVTLY